MNHILVVEDDLEICQLYSRVLVKNGYQVTCVSNGQEALKWMMLPLVYLLPIVTVYTKTDNASATKVAPWHTSSVLGRSAIVIIS